MAGTAFKKILLCRRIEEEGPGRVVLKTGVLRNIFR